MKLDRFFSIMAFAVVLLVGGAASAADLTGRAPGVSAGYCLRMAPSSLLDNPDKAAVHQQIVEWYDHSLDVVDRNATLYNRRPVFTWASETKVACGKALGYLKSGEVEAETVSKCDCFHGRMVHFMR